MRARRVMIIAIVVTAILLVAVGVFSNYGMRAETVPANLNGQELTLFATSQKAIENSVLVTSTDTVWELTFPAENDLSNVYVTLTGQSTAVEMYGDTTISSRLNGSYEPEDGEELKFYFSTEWFEEGETLLFEITFEEAETTVESLFHLKQTTEYVAVTMNHSQ